jgi:GTP-binding protein
MKIHSAEFQISAPDLASCPQVALPEFAFIGRSNVGKSSMINMLLNRKDLAKVSNTPGKTKLINFYTVNGKWNLVDLPGYGYAKVAKTERGRFSNAITEYLQHRANLVGTFVLIDSMIPPQKLDLQFLAWMIDAGLPFILLFTKADRLSPAAAQASMGLFITRLREISLDPPQTVLSSSKLAQGRAEILNLISSALAESASPNS